VKGCGVLFKDLKISFPVIRGHRGSIPIVIAAQQALSEMKVCMISKKRMVFISQIDMEVTQK
jgi:hypothetical protein